MTTPSPDEMKAREIARQIKNMVDCRLDDEAAALYITQALSEKTEEIERLRSLLDPALEQLQRTEQQLEAAEASLSEVSQAAAAFGYEQGYSQGHIDAHQIKQNRCYTMRDEFIRARFQHGGKDNG